MSAKDVLLDRHKNLKAFMDRNPEIAKQVQIIDQDSIGFHAVIHGQTERFDFPFHSGAFREILDEGLAYFARIKYDRMTLVQRVQAGLEGTLSRTDSDNYFRDLDPDQQRAVLERFFPAIETSEAMGEDLESEPDFYEWEFASPADARKAMALLNSATTGPKTVIVRSGAAEGFAAVLQSVGLTWQASPSSVTEEDMWPEWTGDEAADNGVEVSEKQQGVKL
jgi:hypothetical protein